MAFRRRPFLKSARLGKRLSEAKAMMPAMSTNPNLPSKVSVLVLGVKDLAKSVTFYRDTVGLDFKGQHEVLAFFALSDITLMLNGNLRREGAALAGASEIVFSVGSVAAGHDLLKQRGCNFVTQPREVTPGSWAATLADPDGHYLTLFGPK
jgi:predicted enzyme related to lactoylglutathione lyase